MIQRHETDHAAEGRHPSPRRCRRCRCWARPPRRHPPARRSASGQLSMMLQTVRTQDYFWALGVGRDAPAADIDRAYEALARSFHADRYRLAPEDDRKAAQEIFDRLAEAHRTLRDPAKRKSLRRAS